MTNLIFGLAEAAIKLTEQRSAILTNNIANSSTPNYKARDIDFHKTLLDAQEASKHANPATENTLPVGDAKLLYRVPMQTSMDGNTVDDNLERKNFLENAIRYQVSLTFIQNKSDEMTKAMMTGV